MIELMLLKVLALVKRKASKKCIICHYWYFKNIGYKFEPHVCNGCHDILMTAYE